MIRIERLLLAFCVLSLFACSGVSKIDYTRLNRGGWQHPERVMESLAIQPGDHVADIGAGDGYFIPYLAEAVGSEGLVYAVEVDADKIEALEELVEKRQLGNVVVIQGGFDDPLLPDGRVDLVFLCNTYHHIDERPGYFARLKRDLRGPGRLAIVEPKDDMTGILALFGTNGHWTSLELLHRELTEAGYRPAESFDFLPTQNFEVFHAGRLGETPQVSAAPAPDLL